MVGLDDSACDLLLRLLAADPAARPTARQVLLSSCWLRWLLPGCPAASRLTSHMPACSIVKKFCRIACCSPPPPLSP